MALLKIQTTSSQKLIGKPNVLIKVHNFLCIIFKNSNLLRCWTNLKDLNVRKIKQCNWQDLKKILPGPKWAFSTALCEWSFFTTISRRVFMRWPALKHYLFSSKTSRPFFSCVWSCARLFFSIFIPFSFFSFFFVQFLFLRRFVLRTIEDQSFFHLEAASPSLICSSCCQRKGKYQLFSTLNICRALIFLCVLLLGRIIYVCSANIFCYTIIGRAHFFSIQNTILFSMLNICRA